MKFTIVLMIGLLFYSGAAGFCFLKIYDIFKQAMAMKSRLRMWVALTAAVFTLFIIMVSATGISMSLKQHKFSSIRIPAPFHVGPDEQNGK
jgi:hypothetical protein